MAGLYDVDKKLPMPGYLKAVMGSVNERAAFLYLLKHGEGAANKLAQWGVEMPLRRGNPTGLEGADKLDDFQKRVPEVLSCYAQRVESDGWKITDLAGMTDTAMGSGATEAARQQAADAREGFLGVQDMLLTDQDTASSATAVDGKDRTRGVFSWLDPEAQGVLPVAAGCRPTAAQSFNDKLSLFTEDGFAGMLRAACEQVDDDVDLVGYVGSTLAQVMADWTLRVPTTTNVANTRTLQSSQDSNRLVRKVSFFDFEGSSVKTVIQRRMMCDTAGAKTAATTRSGAFLDMRRWELSWLEAWHHIPLVDQGGGPRGFHRGWVRLVCKNPMGQLRVIGKAE